MSDDEVNDLYELIGREHVLNADRHEQVLVRFDRIERTLRRIERLLGAATNGDEQ